MPYKDPEKYLSYHRDYQKRNRIKYSEYQKTYKKKYPERVKETKRKRKNLERNIVGWHTEGEWETIKIQYGNVCPSCRKTGLFLTRDHIIPITKGGSDYIENIQPLCRSCNSIKGNRSNERFSITRTKN